MQEIDRSLLIEGFGKGLRVIESFSDEFPRLTASQAAERAGLTRTAARRYLLSLVHFGYAASDGKHYWLLPAVLRLGRSYLESARLPRLSKSVPQASISSLSHPAPTARRSRSGKRGITLNLLLILILIGGDMV